MANQFRPRARILRQIGDQLIRNEFVALHELVKNAYDAGSSKAVITFEKSHSREGGSITIQDSGIGIRPEVIVSRWLEIGTDNKVHLLEGDEKDLPMGRRPLGEKGLGRFAVAKLGDHIRVITRARDCNEVVVTLDWAKFLEKDYLDEILVPVQERKPRIFKGLKTGTRIEVTKLSRSWTSGDRRNVKLSTLSMLSPFAGKRKFNIIVKSDVADDFINIPNYEQILDHALFTFDCTIEGDRITNFCYEFQPWRELEKVNGREVDASHPLVQQRATLVWLAKPGKKRPRKAADFELLDLKEYKIGKIRFRGRIFNRSRKLLGLTRINVDALLQFLDGNGGVRVFRDGVRIYDYGEPGNDWLDLGARRVNRPGVKLDSNLIVAAVELDRSGSRGLIEKTNREGFIEDEAFAALKNAIMCALQVVENLRREDQFAIMTYYGKGEPGAEPVIETIEELRELVTDSNLDDRHRKEISNCINKVERDYTEMTSVLLKGAASGLHLSLVVHEIEKILKELKHVVKSEKVASRTRSIVNRLTELVDKYSSIIRGRIKKSESLADVVESAKFLSEYRLASHEVDLDLPFLDRGSDVTINCDKNLLTSALLNLIDNSLFWMDHSKSQPKKIRIDFRRKATGGAVLTYCDSGTGYAISEKLLGRPFVSSKPGNSGIGLGLHIVKQITEFHGGTARFTAGSSLALKAPYKKGAAVEIDLPQKHDADTKR